MKDNYTKDWIISNAVEICSRYEKGILTLRALHYQLVAIGMTNDVQHYKRVVTAMISARWSRIISFDTFSDLDRAMVGETKASPTNLDEGVEAAKDAIGAWMKYYFKNRWENQPIYPEVLIEKKALQGVFDRTCSSLGVGMGACKGYPSLTFLHEAYLRYKEQVDEGKEVVIIYFGDYDPSGEDIPRAIEENLSRMGVDVRIERIGLNEEQVLKWNLPPAPAKDTDTRTAAFNLRGGLGQVELDAVKPEVLRSLCKDAILNEFDTDLYDQLKKVEDEEAVEYRKQVKEFVNNL